ncbi:Flp pilus assembly protein CpaB [Chitinimonas arctica]|uniref:Flp pilus assembly protein CpaB n=1 Tax=Chitinimonas arctica TaxID=2594795 RepID=A0A516SLK1_9NEIS|nr:Flp pilus assembly protein CpaB [Chitinimonas arctica]QDQ29032.1 Flp pilus assembly protein CpaB [Chitinimonas arctica]
MKLKFGNVNRTWAMLAAAIVLGLFAMFLTVQYLKLQERSLQSEIEAKVRGKGPTVAVVVPRENLPPGTAIDMEMVAERQVSGELIYDDTITVEQFDSYQGQALIRPVRQGRPLLRGDLRPIYADFAGSLKPGTRAMTIETDELNSIAHMVQPGNQIDLMLVMNQVAPSEPNNPAAAAKDSKVVVPFMLGVKILATGQKVVHDAPAGDGPVQRSTYSTYTLEVNPGQAMSLVMAQEMGKLRVVLRNEKDAVARNDPAAEYDTDSAGSLMRSIAARSQAAAKANAMAAKASIVKEPVDPGDVNAYIEYIIGGKGSGGVTPSLNVALPPGYGGLTAPPAGAPSPLGAPLSVPANVMPYAAAAGVPLSTPAPK